MAYAGVMLSRATLCEIMAMKLTGHFASNEIQLVAVLMTSWNPLNGAPPNIVEEVKQALGDSDDPDPQSALEVSCPLPSLPLLYERVRIRWQLQRKRKRSSLHPSCSPL